MGWKCTKKRKSIILGKAAHHNACVVELHFLSCIGGPFKMNGNCNRLTHAQCTATAKLVLSHKVTFIVSDIQVQSPVELTIALISLQL